MIHATLATFVYAKMPLVKYYTKFSLSLDVDVLEAVLFKLHVKLAPGWVLIRVTLTLGQM